MKKEVSLDPQMRRLYRPLPLFLTPEAPGRVIGMISHFISIWSQRGNGWNPRSEEGGIMAITTGKMRTISADERVSPTKEEGSRSGSAPVKERCTEKCPDSPLGTRRGEGFVWGQEDSSP